MAEPDRAEADRAEVDRAEAGEGAVIDPGDVSAALWRLIQEVPHANATLAGRLGAGTSDVVALQHLLLHGPTGPAGLAELLGMSTASATVLVDRLVAAGHAARRPHPSDRRRVEVAATATAQAEVVGHLAPLFAELAAAQAAVHPSHRTAVADYLDAAAVALARFAAARGDAQRG